MRHLVRRSSVCPDASWEIECDCGRVFLGKDRSECYQRWLRHLEEATAVDALAVRP